MADVFISYARKDIEFVHRLVAALQAQIYDVWVDWGDIPTSSDWMEANEDGIENASAFLCIISPAWATRPLCHKELAHAISHKKRLIPVVREPINEQTFLSLINQMNDSSEIRNPVELARKNWAVVTAHNWIFVEDDALFDQSVEQIIAAIKSDLEYARKHTHYLMAAKKWDVRGRKPEFLLIGEELREAVVWLEQSTSGENGPTDLHQQYITESQYLAPQHNRPLLLLGRSLINRLLQLGPRKIFISYRRADTSDVCGRIFDRLEPAFGKKNIFLDVDSIDYGSDFSQFIQQTLTECFAVLVVIGPQWVKLLKERSEKPEADFVRIEVETALKRQHLKVIPLFVSGAESPNADDLPNELRALPLKNGTPIRAGRDFHRDMDTLIKELKKLRSQGTKDSPA